MNSKYKYLFVLLVAVLFSNCTTKPKQITNINDYNAFLRPQNNETLIKAEKNMAFWSQKLEQTPDQYPYLEKLASTNTDYFSATGNVTYLIDAEKQLLELNKITNYGNSSYLRSLAFNYVSQHRFQEALMLLTKAEGLGDNLQMTQKMLFDVHLELGNYDKAQIYLNTFQNFSDFDYLIRLSKLSDHKGDLEAAISYMERAMNIAESSNLNDLKLWSYTNIADFYGHAGQIEQSYEYYLKALRIDPNDAYAKKGIAWIVYSHEKNPEEALRILDAVTESFHSPDYNLLKAEIAEFLGNETIAENEIKRYKMAVNNTAYGTMYNAYNVLLYTDTNSNLEEAIRIARSEVMNRPTPQSYDLLAWAYFKNGNSDMALRLVEDHIINRTYEPETLYRAAEIYKSVGDLEKIKPLKDELLASIYELGPSMESKIKNL